MTLNYETAFELLFNEFRRETKYGKIGLVPMVQPILPSEEHAEGKSLRNVRAMAKHGVLLPDEFHPVKSELNLTGQAENR